MKRISSALTGLMVLGVLAPAACAADWENDFNWDIHRYKAVRHHRHHKPVTHYYRQPIEEREIEIRRDEPREEWQCIEAQHVVGSQWVDEAGAESSAKKAFMEQVRFRFGEQWMDVANAKDYEKRCTRSSVGKVLNTYYWRCEIAAKPCRPPLEKAEKDSRR